MFPNTFPQIDEHVRALVADGRAMFSHTPLSQKELELLAKAAIVADDGLGAHDEEYEHVKDRGKS